MLEDLKKEHRAKMEKVLVDLQHAFDTLRTGRASLSLVDHLQVEAYGAQMPLIQLASLSTPDARTIAIQPFDPSQIGAIQKALLASDLGITPANDGKTIRLHIPQLTEERRKGLVKLARKYAEDHRIGIRQVRHHFNDELRRMNHEHEIPDDDYHRLIDEEEKATKEFISKVDEQLKKKEAEIMEV
jgi:ribosome recycling factor